jgi:hypothetical protein
VLDVEVKLGVGYVCMYVLYVLYVQGSSGESSVLTLLLCPLLYAYRHQYSDSLETSSLAPHLLKLKGREGLVEGGGQ